MKKFRNIANKYAGLIFAVSLIILWEFSGFMDWLPRFIIPTPSQIVTALINDRVNLWDNSRVTLLQAFIGLGIGIVLAFILAIVMDY